MVEWCIKPDNNFNSDNLSLKKGLIAMDLGASILLSFLVLPLLLPFIIGLIIFSVFGKDELGRIAGFFVFKPVIAYPIWFWGPFAWLQQETTHIKVLDSLLLLLPGLILTIVIVYPLRHLFYQHRLIQLFLIGDVLRWGISWIYSSSGLGIPNISQSTVELLLGSALIYPSIYAVVVFVVLMMRKRLVGKRMMERELVQSRENFL